MIAFIFIYLYFFLSESIADGKRNFHTFELATYSCVCVCFCAKSTFILYIIMALGPLACGFLISNKTQLPPYDKFSKFF